MAAVPFEVVTACLTPQNSANFCSNIFIYLPKGWKEYRVMQGGLPSVANVLINAIEDGTGVKSHSAAFRILKRIYSVTYPFWIVQYKKYGSFAAAFGLVSGLYPPNLPSFAKINLFQKIKLNLIYLFISCAGLIFPSSLFEVIRVPLYRWVRRKQYNKL